MMDWICRSVDGNKKFVHSIGEETIGTVATYKMKEEMGGR
jgi:hypothetical protein